jgi:hypothetical protein
MRSVEKELSIPGCQISLKNRVTIQEKDRITGLKINNVKDQAGIPARLWTHFPSGVP